MAHALRDRILASPAGSQRSLEPDEMLALAQSVDLATLDLTAYKRFDNDCYARNTVLLNEHVELVVICWRPDQASSIHDHGRSNCLYLVTAGTMQEEQFELNENRRPRRLRARHFETGAIMIAAPLDVHRIMNPGPEPLVTLHIYSPPLDKAVTNFTPIPGRKTTSTSD